MPTRKHVLDLVEQRVFDPITRAALVDRTVLDSFLTAELEELASQEQFTAFFAVYHDPLLRTTTGGREYLLPKDFPENTGESVGKFQPHCSEVHHARRTGD